VCAGYWDQLQWVDPAPVIAQRRKLRIRNLISLLLVAALPAIAVGVLQLTPFSVGASTANNLALAALAWFPDTFSVGVDVCGIADFATFYAHTEPWIATSATSKYGDPHADATLLHELSPLHRIDRITAPLLVVHGAHDTNVPLGQAQQVVDVLRERGASPGFLLFEDEGHEVHATDNRVVFVREVVRWVAAHLLGLSEQTA
jgi:fermentation-respiration switch protein FrsA (DUF1100 family)